jgi:5-methylcytosine-specific restriction protein A
MPKRIETFRRPSVPKFEKPRDNTAHRRFINSPAWRRCSKSYLLRHPQCAPCWERGVLTPAVEVHHTRGQDPEFYFDESTFVPCCHSCHSRLTASGQKGKEIKVTPPKDEPHDGHYA